MFDPLSLHKVCICEKETTVQSIITTALHYN